MALSKLLTLGLPPNLIAEIQPSKVLMFYRLAYLLLRYLFIEDVFTIEAYFYSYKV